MLPVSERERPIVASLGDRVTPRRCHAIDVRYHAVLCAAAVLLAGCASGPQLATLEAPPSPHLSAAAPPGIEDARATFRVRFCESFASLHPAEEGIDCGGWLHRLEDEPAGPPEPLPVQGATMDVLLVTGAFSECFGDDARPFHSAIEELEGAGYRFATVVVGGRSSAEHNAAQIAAFLEAHPPEHGRELVLVGYSKGTTDILRFLVDYPGHAADVDAVISIAGAVYGSPLADLFDGPYHLLFSHLPMNRCAKGDNDVVHSLRTDLRREWLENNRLPAHVRYYSLAAFTTRDRLARSLVPTWKMLLKHGTRNDGQLLATDALIPGSTVLGYLNADHWAVAMEIEKELEFWAHRKFSPAFPHAALLDAMLGHVGADLAVAGLRAGDSRPATE